MRTAVAVAAVAAEVAGGGGGGGVAAVATEAAATAAAPAEAATTAATTTGAAGGGGGGGAAAHPGADAIRPCGFLHAVPLFAPNALGVVVVRANEAVQICALGDLYSLKVQPGQPPVPAVEWGDLPVPSLDPEEFVPGSGYLGGMRQDVKVDGHSIGKRCASSSSTSASVPAPVPLGRCRRLPLPSAPLPTHYPLSHAAVRRRRFLPPPAIPAVPLCCSSPLTLSAAVCPILGTTSRPMFCCRSASRTKIKLLYLKLKNVILDFGVACRRAAARIALLLLRGVIRVFRGFGQCQAAPTHPHVFCGLDQKFLTDTPQFYIFSSVVHAQVNVDILLYSSLLT